MRFEWDDKKAAANLRKHKVFFLEAVSVFYDPYSATGDDPDHSFSQQRFVTLWNLSIRTAFGRGARGPQRRDSDYQRAPGHASGKRHL